MFFDFADCDLADRPGANGVTGSISFVNKEKFL